VRGGLLEKLGGLTPADLSAEMSLKLQNNLQIHRYARWLNKKATLVHCISMLLVYNAKVSVRYCQNVLVPNCLGSELSGHFGTSAHVSLGHFGMKCLGAEVSRVRSVSH